MGDQASGVLSPWLRKRRLRAVMPYLGRGRVLDFGCGIGSLAAHVPPACYLGVDSDLASIELARCRRPQHHFISTAELHEWSRDEKFDVILGLALIEHLELPAKWLGEMRELLALEGRIVLTTPHPWGRWAHELGARMGLFSRAAAEEHTTLAGVGLMQVLAAQSGLRVVVIRRFLLGFNQLFVLEAT